MITEKTLELNLTFEMLTLGDTMWNLIHFASCAPRVIASCSCYRPVRLPARLRPCYAIGMSLQDEITKGWDVKIQFPSSSAHPSHALFLQYKAGKHLSFSKKRKSIFYGSKLQPSPFCQFSINNNSTRDQHIVLRALASQKNLRGAVAYVFPRVCSARMLKACLGRLVHVTNIVTVNDLDLAAKKKKISISKGTRHHFRTSYTSPIKTELCSETTELSSPPSILGNVFADVIACRLYQTLVAWQDILRIHWHREDFNQINWAEMFLTYEAEIARHLAVSPEHFFSRSEQRHSEPEIREVLSAGMAEHASLVQNIASLSDTNPREQMARDEPPALHAGLLSYQERLSIFNQTMEAIGPYRRLMRDANTTDGWPDSEIPPPQTSVAKPFSQGGINLDISELDGHIDKSVVIDGLSGISYQII